MIRWKFQLDGSTGFTNPGSKGSPPRSYRCLLPVFFVKDQSNEDRGDAKKNNTPQMEPKLQNQPTKKKSREKKNHAQLEPKNHFLFSMKKFPDSNPPPNLPFLSCQSDAMDAPRRPSFFCMGRSDGTIGPELNGLKG